MDSIIDQEVLLREAGAEMPAQEGQDIIFRVDDCAQHPVVLLKTDKALKLVHFPVQTLLHLVKRSHLRVTPPLDSARPQCKGQM